MTAQRLLHLVLLPIKKNLDLFSFIFFGEYIYYIVDRLTFNTFQYPILLSFFFLIIDVYFFCLLATLGGKIVKGIIFFVIGFLLFAEDFILLNFKTQITVSLLTIVLQTDGVESNDFVRMCISKPETWWSIILFICTLVLTVAVIPRLIRLFTSKLFSGITLGKRASMICLSAIFMFFMLCAQKQAKHYRAPAQIMYEMLFSHKSNPKYEGGTPSCWQRLIVSSMFILKESMDSSTIIESTRNATVDSCSFMSPTIVLVVGESFNKYHTPLYNEQSLPTTPQLCGRTKQGNVIPFYDVVSPYNSTSKVISQMFSMCSIEDKDNWSSYPLYLALFKKSGYEVTFVSNQFVNKLSDFWDAIGGQIFNARGLDSLQLNYRNGERFGYDINIIKEYQAIRTEGDHPRLIVFHLYGQHVSYKSKHPEDYTPIAKEDIKLEYNDSEQARDIAWHYANATHYNDFVVDSIFKLFDDTETVGIYLSDHGEEVYDFRDFYHRSHEDPSYYNIAKYEYEVPFMFYATDKYQAAHPEIMQQIREAKDRPFMTDDLPQVMLYLAGIKQKDYDETRNVLSPNFNTKRKRLLNDKYDFDAIRAASKEQ